ncbi:MAG: ISNCY family transposase, partial [Methylomicrobium sp.]|nr:ISNCY family transposase [Methylomicrobium sp.]
MDLEIIDLIRRTFEDLPDFRKPGNNRKYRIEDAVLSAFSVFFTQSPSFLDYQRRMEKLHNRNNAQSIFGVHQIPSTSQIGNLLDPIAPETLYPVLAEVGDRLYTQGCLKPFVSVGGTLLVALDGTDSFSSEKISCPCCTQQTLKNGQTL